MPKSRLDIPTLLILDDQTLKTRLYNKDQLGKLLALLAIAGSAPHVVLSPRSYAGLETKQHYLYTTTHILYHIIGADPVVLTIILFYQCILS